MMKINILQAKTAIGSRETFEFVTSTEKIDLEGEGPWVSNEIKVEGELINNGRVLKIKGVIHATAKYQCNYCYANRSPKLIQNNIKRHKIDNPTLIGLDLSNIEVQPCTKDKSSKNKQLSFL